MLSQNVHCLTRPIQWVLLVCLAAGIALVTRGCAPELTPLPVPTVAVEPSPVPTVAVEPSPAPTVAVEPSPAPTATVGPFALRGIWVHRGSLRTQEEADRALARVRAGNFNAIFVNLYRNGCAYYESDLVDRCRRVGPGFDPLAYVVAEGHRAGLQVHVWFTTGRQGSAYKDLGRILINHPEWGLASADGGLERNWLNLAHPEARQFMSDVMLEVVEKYEVDGVHFDYIRYPAPDLGFDSYSIEAMAREYGVDLASLRYEQLPAYGSLRGNPLGGVETAEVLAEFDDGTPAVLLNSYGAGEVIVLNWHAQERVVAVGSEILRRSVDYLLDEGGKVYIMRSETTIARKGDKYFRQNRVWLRHLGWEPIEVTEEDDLGNLGVSSVLVMPNVYWIEAATAAQLAGFVEGGGGLIFIDGPVKSMGNEAIRAVTGMRGSVRYFEGEKMVLAVGESELIPDGGPAVDLRAREGIISHWNDFREAGVSALVEDVYQRVKAVRPEVQVSAAVLRCENSALSKFQNWYNWLAGGYIDFVVPMAYVSEVSSLEGVVDEWRTKGDLERTAAGLGVKDFGGDGAMKTPEQLLEEIELIQGRGIDGVVLFDFENLSDEQLEALATGPFAP